MSVDAYYQVNNLKLQPGFTPTLEKQVSQFNATINKLNPSGILIRTICGVVQAILATVALYYASTLPVLIPLGIFVPLSVVLFGWAIKSVYDEVKNIRKYNKLTQEISQFPSGLVHYKDTVFYREELFNNLLPGDEFSTIKSYFNDNADSIIYKRIEREFVYELSGGEIRRFSVSPLNLKNVKNTFKIKEANQDFSSWIKLMVSVEKSSILLDMKKAINETIRDFLIFSDASTREINEEKNKLNPHFHFNFDNQGRVSIDMFFGGKCYSYPTAHELRVGLNEAFKFYI